MKLTKALSDYLDAVNKHVADYGVFYPVNRTSNPELKLVKFAAVKNQDPADVANVIVRFRRDEDVPTHLLWMAGALDVFFYQQ